LAKVKDFSPYISKIKAWNGHRYYRQLGDRFSAADQGEQGLRARSDLLPFNAQNAGAPSSIGPLGDHIKNVSSGIPTPAEKQKKFRQRISPENTRHFYYATARPNWRCWQAMNEAKSADPLIVGKSLKGMKVPGRYRRVWMRADITI